MQRTNLKISLIIAIFFLAVVNQARAHPPCGGYHGTYRGDMLPPTGFQPGEGYWYPPRPAAPQVIIIRK